MKITQALVTISSLLTVADSEDNETFLGLETTKQELTLDQAYELKAAVCDDLTLNILTGQAEATEALDLIGGAGVDPDGEEIALTEVAVIHMRNTGVHAIKVTLDFNGAPNAISSLPIQPGGELALNSQNITTDADLVIEPITPDEKISCTVVIAGKQ